MPPQFKKPVEYDPSMAERTLQKTFATSEQAIEAKKRTLLAELGLADEEYEVDDDDDDMEDPDVDEEDEEPLLVNNNATIKAHVQANGKTALPSYGYRDLFGKDLEKRRRQLIEVKGYDQYLADLVDRSYEQLQALRAETGLQYPGNVEVIPELQHELRLLHQQYKTLRDEQPGVEGLPSARPAAQTEEANGLASNQLRQQVASLQQQLAARDTRIKEVEAEAARLKRALAAKEGELHALQDAAVVSDTSKSDGSAQAVVQLTRQRDNALEACEQLERQVAKLRSDAAASETSLREQLAALSSSSKSDQAAVLQRQLTAARDQHNSRVAELEAELQQKQAQIQQLQTMKSDALAAMKEMKGKMASIKTDTAAGYKAQLAAVQAKLDALHALREGVLEDLVAFQSEIFSDKTITQMVRLVRDREIARVRSAQTDLKTKLADMEAKVKQADETTQAVREAAEQAARIRELEAAGQIQHFQEKWRTEFEKRRKLHNLVLELKGNIRVLCRVRPLVDKERAALANGNGANPDIMPVRVTSEEALRVAAVDNKAEKDFEFDRVLSPDDGQDKLYDEVSALVTSVLDGFNVAIMAYGQTGSGKTYTMEGPEGNPGVNLRALADLFRLAADRSEGFNYTFSASVLEIYNEQIYDLLVSGAQDGDKLDVKQGAEGMYVAGLKVEEVRNMNEVNALINRGKSNRSTFATNMNEHSSRSHLVLSLYISCVSKLTGATLRGKLHLIDLAGSERLSRTGAQGDRLKEAQAINKSLSALGDVIQALQQRNAHIPYRNSKLTRLLEDSLGGNSKCIMIVNVSPAGENVSETKCSLEFASRARKVELGRARANVVSADGSPSAAPSPSPSRPMSGRATPTNESSISRVGSREAMATSNGRRTPGPSALSR